MELSKAPSWMAEVTELPLQVRTHSHGKIIVVNKCSGKELASPQSDPRSLEVSQKC
jgi:hypothetical protein